jgi:hypothetical protein
MHHTMPEQIAEIAARNNAAWCDAVCRAHGGATTVDDAVWFNAAPSPRFYPNVVTLRPGAAAAVDAVLQRRVGALPAVWGIKDSFADLDLRSRGFAVAFEARWLWRDAAAGGPASRRDDGIAWEAVESDEALAGWEREWASGAAAAPRQFPTRLLARREIAFVQGRRDGVIVAGGVLNAGGGAVGITNVFGVPDDLADCWARLADEAVRRFPGLPLCGYERPGPDAVPLALGFEAVGPLRVWLRGGA